MTTPTWHEVGSLCEAAHVLITRADLSHDLLVEMASPMLRRVGLMHQELLLDPHGDSDIDEPAADDPDPSVVHWVTTSTGRPDWVAELERTGVFVMRLDPSKPNSLRGRHGKVYVDRSHLGDPEVVKTLAGTMMSGGAIIPVDDEPEDSPAKTEPCASRARAWMQAAGGSHVPDAPMVEVLRELDPEASVWEIPCADDGPSRFVVKDRSLNNASVLATTPNAAVLSALACTLHQLREEGAELAAQVGLRGAGTFSTREAMHEAGVPHSQLGGGVSVADGIRYLAKQRDELATERNDLAKRLAGLAAAANRRDEHARRRLEEVAAIAELTGVERGPNEDVVSWVGRGVDELRRNPGEATDEVRENMLINLREWLLNMEAKAELDSDPVSIEGFTDDNDLPMGGLVLIRTTEAFAAVLKFCEAKGLLTPGKGIDDGTTTTVKP